MTNSDKIPEGFKRRLYEDYKYNMKFYGKEQEIMSYEKWLKEVLSSKNITQKNKNYEKRRSAQSTNNISGIMELF